MDVIQFKKIKPSATLPSKGSPFSAGLDIYCPEEVTLYPFQQRLVKTGLKVILPIGTYGRIAPRSGLALNQNIWINGGVIDPDFTGELGVIIMNMGPIPYTIKKDAKFCQLICEKIALPKIEETKTIPITQRGKSGFGSTDK